MMSLIIRQYETNKKLGEALLNCLISVYLDFLAEYTCAQMLKVTDRKANEDSQHETVPGNQGNHQHETHDGNRRHVL